MGLLPFKGFLLDGSITMGAIRNEASRSINAGSEHAEGTFWGGYIAPQAALSKRFEIAPQWAVTTGVQLRYVGAFYEGYTEHGSSQNLSYDSRQSHSVEGRLRMDLTHETTISDNQTLALSLNSALVDTHNLGRKSYGASLENTEFTLTDSTDRNVQGVSLGASFSLGPQEGYCHVWWR